MVVRRWTRGALRLRRVHYRPKDTVFAGIPCLWADNVLLRPQDEQMRDVATRGNRRGPPHGVADCAQGGFVRSRIDVAG